MNRGLGGSTRPDLQGVGAGSAIDAREGDSAAWVWLLSVVCLALGTFPIVWLGRLDPTPAIFVVIPIVALSAFALVRAMRLQRGGRGSYALITIAVIACGFNLMWMRAAVMNLVL
jgi:hypothetical protein